MMLESIRGVGESSWRQPANQKSEPIWIASNDDCGEHLGNIFARFRRQRPCPVKIPEISLLDGVLYFRNGLLHPGRAKVVRRKRKHDGAACAKVQDQVEAGHYESRGPHQ